jgi:hypothetical protein
MNSSLRLTHSKTPDYQRGLATRWDVDPKDGAQIDEMDGRDEKQHDLVGVPLVTHQSDSNSDSDISINGFDDFMQQMDVEDQSMRLTP